jgi:hypothetical protein
MHISFFYTLNYIKGVLIKLFLKNYIIEYINLEKIQINC